MSQNTLIVSRRIQLWLLGLVIFTIWIFWTLLPSVGIGLTVAVVVYPHYRRAYRFFQVSEKSARSETIFSILVTVGVALLCMFFLALPFWIVIGNLPEIQTGLTAFMENLDKFQDSDLARAWGITFNWSEYQAPVINGLKDFGWASLSAVPGMLLAFFVFSMTLYLGVRFGAAVYRRVLFSIEIQTREILQRISTCSYRTLYAIYVVHMATVLLTFVLSIPLFLMLGMPNILLWAVIFAIFQLIPFIGPSIIVVVLIVMQIVGGDAFVAQNTVVLIVYGYGVVCLLPDFIVRPYLMGKQSGINPLVMWLGFFGGIAIMGPSGFVFGPLLLAILIEAVNVVLERFPDPLLQMERETGRRINVVAETEDLEKMFQDWQHAQEHGGAGANVMRDEFGVGAGTAGGRGGPGTQKPDSELPTVIVRHPESGRHSQVEVKDAEPVPQKFIETVPAMPTVDGAGTHPADRETELQSGSALSTPAEGGGSGADARIEETGEQNDQSGSSDDEKKSD